MAIWNAMYLTMTSKTKYSISAHLPPTLLLRFVVGLVHLLFLALSILSGYNEHSKCSVVANFWTELVSRNWWSEQLCIKICIKMWFLNLPIRNSLHEKYFTKIFFFLFLLPYILEELKNWIYIHAYLWLNYAEILEEKLRCLWGLNYY
jgi:hypothetical protein